MSVTHTRMDSTHGLSSVLTFVSKRLLSFNETSFSQLSYTDYSSQTYGNKAALHDSSVSGEAIYRDSQKNISID